MADRVSTLSIVGSIDLTGPRAELAKFREEAAQNPVMISTAAAASGGTYTSRTFGGQTVSSTAPPGAPPPITPAVNLPGGFQITTRPPSVPTPPQQLIPTVNIPSAGNAQEAALQQWLVGNGFSPAQISQVMGAGGGGAIPPAAVSSSLLMSPGAISLGAAGYAALAGRLGGEALRIHQQRVAMESMNLGEQVQYQQGFVSSQSLLQYTTGKVLSFTPGLGFLDPDEQERQLAGARLSLRSGEVADTAREETRQTREFASTIGLAGYSKESREAENKFQQTHRDIGRRRQAMLKDTSEAGILATKALNDDEQAAKDERDAEFARIASDRGYDVDVLNIDADRKATIFGSPMTADRDAVVKLQKAKISRAQKQGASPEEIAALQNDQAADLRALDYDQFTRRGSSTAGILYGTLQAQLKGQGQDYEAGRSEIQAQNYQDLLSARENRFGVIVRGFTRLNAYDTINQRQTTATAGAMEAAGRAESLEQAGSYGAAGRASVESSFRAAAGDKYTPVLNSKGEITAWAAIDPANANIAKAMTDRFNIALTGAGISVEGQRLLTQGYIESNRLAAAGDPFGAQLADIEARRRAELLKKTDQPTIDLINQKYDSMTNLATSDRTFRASQYDIGAQGEQSALQSALRREPDAAQQASLIGSQGLMSMKALAHEGMYDQVEESFKNTKLRLQLLSQQYTDAFRGVQGSQLTLGFTQRNSESAQSVQQAIDKAVQDLIKGFTDAMLGIMDTGG